MKKMGIIGGAGPLASALFYEIMVRESYRKACQLPEIILINFPFTRGLSLEEGKDNRGIIQDQLDYCIHKLAQNEVTEAILTCNTLHLYLPIEKSIIFHSLPELVMQHALQNGDHRLLILGTQNTCRSELYQHPKMEMVYPSSCQQKLIDDVIDRVLVGKICEADSRLLSQIIKERNRKDSFDGVVLGCTDLPVLHHHYPIQSLKPFYDSIKIPAKVLGGTP